MELHFLDMSLLPEYRRAVDFNPSERLKSKSEHDVPFNRFEFYRSVSSVYSSKIEGEEIEVDSFMKHKFLNVSYETDYTKRADDLFEAYTFIENNELNAKNVLNTHSILSKNLLSASNRGKIRNNPMFVLNEDDRIEYVVCDPSMVQQEWDNLFNDIRILLKADLSDVEVFFMLL